jgi:hypothetical protein
VWRRAWWWRRHCGTTHARARTTHTHTHNTQIEQILKTLNATLVQKDKALNEFKVQHKIRVMGEDDDEAPAPQAASSSTSSGVLV